MAVDFRLLAGAGVPACDFKAGDVIFNQGEPARELFIIQSGIVEIRLGNRVLEKLSQYSIFGSNTPYCALNVMRAMARRLRTASSTL